MSFNNPAYAHKVRAGLLPGSTLTPAEYAALLLLIPYAGMEPVLETDGKVVTSGTAGEIVYAARP